MVDDAVKLIGAVSGLITAVAWPLVFGWLIWRFTPVLRDFLSNMSEGSIKAFGVEATAKRNAAVEIVKADLSKPEVSKRAMTKLQWVARAENAMRSAEALTSVLPVKELRGRSLLWVDDEPEDTYYERNALTELGLKMDIVTNANDALSNLRTKKYNVVVVVPQHITNSDDWTLLRGTLKITRSPYIIYNGSNQSNVDPQTFGDGAYGIPTDVTSLVLSVSGAARGLYSSDAMQDWVHHYEHVRDIIEDR
jgi:CheY-like chemotaxis protein